MQEIGKAAIRIIYDLSCFLLFQRSPEVQASSEFSDMGVCVLYRRCRLDYLFCIPHVAAGTQTITRRRKSSITDSDCLNHFFAIRLCTVQLWSESLAEPDIGCIERLNVAVFARSRRDSSLGLLTLVVYSVLHDLT